MSSEQGWNLIQHYLIGITLFLTFPSLSDLLGGLGSPDRKLRPKANNVAKAPKKSKAAKKGSKAGKDRVKLVPSIIDNDTCQTATAFQPDLPFQVVTGNTIGALPHVPSACAANTIPRPDVWFSSLGVGKLITLTTCNPGTNFDTEIIVLTGNCESLGCMYFNDDNSASCPSNNLASTLTFQGAVGVLYYIAITGHEGAAGQFELSVTLLDILDSRRALNNDCGSAIRLSSGESVVGNTTQEGVTASNLELCPGSSIDQETWYSADDKASPDLWYSVVGTGRTLIASTCFPETTFDTMLFVYKGTCNSDVFTCIEYDDDFCSHLAAWVSWPSEIGVIYYIRVNGYRLLTGDFRLTLSSE